MEFSIKDALKIGLDKQAQNECKAKNKRQFILSLIFDILKEEADKQNKKCLTKQGLGFKTSHLSLHDLEYILSVGKEYKSKGKLFSVFFWGSLKVK